MKIKSKYLEVKNSVLGEDTIFSLIQAEDYNGFDTTTGKSTGERQGTRFTVLVDVPEKEVYYEKLEVKIAGTNPIPQYKSGDNADCRFTNLQLNITSIEYGRAEIKATADGIELVNADERQEQSSKSQMKINANK